MVHGELTTLLWGGTFGFVWAYVVTARALVGRHPGVRSPRGAITSVTSEALVFTPEEIPSVPAFFHWSLEVSGVHSKERRFQTVQALGPRETRVALDPARGRYKITVRWILTDMFGFSRLIPSPRWEAVLTVEPRVQGPTQPPPSTPQPGNWRPKNQGRRAGDPFDVRPYIPGDDLRRLHWPLFAHSDIPFVRTADPSPPPSGRQFFILDTGAPGEPDLDLRLGALVGWTGTLSAQGTAWTVVIPAANLSLTQEAAPGPFLAALSPAPLPDGPVPPAWPNTVTLVTGPGSPGASKLAKKLAATRRMIETVEVPLALPPVEPRRPWWRRKS